MSRIRNRLAVAMLAFAGLACSNERAATTEPMAAQGASAGSRAGVGGAAAPGQIPDLRTIFEDGCVTATVQAELLPSTLLFVIDRSSSMACNPPPITQSADCELESTRDQPSAPSKWEIVRRELLATLASLPDSSFAGLSYFSNDDACGVHATPSVEIAALSSEQRSAIDLSLSHVQPSGATPLVGAVVLAYQHLHQEALAGRFQGEKFVVLLTDGEQSDECVNPGRCDTAQQCTDLLISDEVPKAAAQGVRIKTFVIGAPGSEPARRVLSQIALRGQTSPPGCSVERGNCHFDMTQKPEFAPALAAALRTIAGQTQTCDFPLPRGAQGSADPTRVNVVYSPGGGAATELIVPIDGAACDAGAEGWQYTNDASRIRLCGSACARVRNNAEARVHVVLGCRMRVPQ